MAKKRKTTNSQNQLVIGYLEGISSKVFEDYPREITELVAGRHGVYALYKRNRLYYVGLASNLKKRVKKHLQDKHAGKWDRFSLYLVRKADHVKELEALILRIADPTGNSVKGRLPHAEKLSRDLKRKIRNSHKAELDEILGLTKKLGKKHTSQKKRATRKRSATNKQHRAPSLAPYMHGKKFFFIKRTRTGTKYQATVRADGSIRFAGKIYNSPSTAARAILKRAVNGWSFWTYRNENGEWVKLDELRKKP